jgi:hypothetical protein
MELSPYVENLRSSLAAAGNAAAEEVRDAAERLSYAVEPSLRLTLIEVLGDAAAEVTSQLDGVVVDVRLRGGTPELVVEDDRMNAGFPDSPPSPPVPPVSPEPPVPPAPPMPPDPDEGTSRVSLRLPDTLKTRVEDAAAAAGQSVNSWLVRAIAAQLDGPTTTPGSWAPPAPGRVGRRVTGWVR